VSITVIDAVNRSRIRSTPPALGNGGAVPGKLNSRANSNSVRFSRNGTAELNRKIKSACAFRGHNWEIHIVMAGGFSRSRMNPTACLPVDGRSGGEGDREYVGVKREPLEALSPDLT